MYLQILKNIMSYKQLHQAEVAEQAGISRAAVSRWFQSKKGWVNVESKTLLNLAKALGVEPSLFLEKRDDLSAWKTSFLWDHLYPSMEDFVRALVQNRLPAVARLVQVSGFHSAKAIIGKRAIVEFEKYKKFLKPVRRKQLEVLWPLYSSQQ